MEDCRAAHAGESPMAVLLQNLKIDDKFTAVHCTWTEAELLKKYVEKKGNVCICPLTEVGYCCCNSTPKWPDGNRG